MTPIWKQASSSAGFYRLRAGLLENNKTVWMFDNEIDWVIQGRAHCKAAVMRLEQVFKVRRVSLGVVTRERVSVASYSQGEVT